MACRPGAGATARAGYAPERTSRLAASRTARDAGAYVRLANANTARSRFGTNSTVEPKPGSPPECMKWNPSTQSACECTPKPYADERAHPAGPAAGKTVESLAGR